MNRLESRKLQKGRVREVRTREPRAAPMGTVGADGCWREKSGANIPTPACITAAMGVTLGGFAVFFDERAGTGKTYLAPAAAGRSAQVERHETTRVFVTDQ